MIVKKVYKLKYNDAFRVHRELIEGKEFARLKNGDWRFLHDEDWENLWKKTEGDKPVNYEENVLSFLEHEELWGDSFKNEKKVQIENGKEKIKKFLNILPIFGIILMWGLIFFVLAEITSFTFVIFIILFFAVLMSIKV